MENHNFTEAVLNVSYMFANALTRKFPYEHLYIEDVFPPEFYSAMLGNLPTPDELSPLDEVRPVTKGSYKERFVLCFDDASLAELAPSKQAFWLGLRNALSQGVFPQILLKKYSAGIESRFKEQEKPEYSCEMMLVQDTTAYALGPHTDSKRKVITVLFYLPKDLSQVHLGTSLYLPKGGTFTCPGGPHYRHENFLKAATMPFLPNSVFSFLKSERSFHGVEKISDAHCQRWLLLFDIFIR